MKARYLIVTLLMSTIGMVACNPGENPLKNPIEQQRTVVYSVGDKENSTRLETDAEWEKLLDNFCDYALHGEQVRFYSISPSPEHHAAKDNSKKKTTISTQSREEIKEWMKKMEKEGKTVNVSYDEKTDTWNGVAYAGIGDQTIDDGQEHTGTVVLAACPPISGVDEGSEVWTLQNDDTVFYLAFMGNLLFSDSSVEVIGDVQDVPITLHGVVSVHTDNNGEEYYVLDLFALDKSLVVGYWQLSDYCKIVSESDNTNNDASIYWRDAQNTAVYYLLKENGTVMAIEGENSVEGEWSVSDDGLLCCDVFEKAGCWFINWLSSDLMVLSCDEYLSTGGYVFHHMILTSTNQ